jgi:hypothetical protein
MRRPWTCGRFDKTMNTTFLARGSGGPSVMVRVVACPNAKGSRDACDLCNGIVRGTDGNVARLR